MNYTIRPEGNVDIRVEVSGYVESVVLLTEFD